MSTKPGQPGHRDGGGIDVLDRPGTGTGATAERAVAKPPQWHAMLLNDPVTPFEFVVHMLMAVFSKSEDEAAVIMMDAHEKGRAAILSSTEDVVRTKVDEANGFSRQHGFYLTCQAQKG